MVTVEKFILLVGAKSRLRLLDICPGPVTLPQIHRQCFWHTAVVMYGTSLLLVNDM